MRVIAETKELTHNDLRLLSNDWVASTDTTYCGNYLNDDLSDI